MIFWVFNFKYIIIIFGNNDYLCNLFISLCCTLSLSFNFKMITMNFIIYYATTSVYYSSFDCYSQLLHFSSLFFRKLPEEFDFLFISRFPLIVCFEGTLQMCLYINIKCLRFNLWIWWVVHAWYGFGTWKMMQIGGKFMEFCSGSLLLELCFFDSCFPGKIFEIFSYFFILSLNML